MYTSSNIGTLHKQYNYFGNKRSFQDEHRSQQRLRVGVGD